LAFSLNERVGNQNKHINSYLYIAELLVKGKFSEFWLREVLFRMAANKMFEILRQPRSAGGSSGGGKDLSEADWVGSIRSIF
jgi:hypothetical protein